MECVLRFIQAAFDELEMDPGDVSEVELEHTPPAIWSVLIGETYVFFDGNDRHPYVPYTTVQPYTREELLAMGFMPD